MTEIFLQILNMSISASYIVLAVFLLRFLLKKAPKWITVFLWGSAEHRKSHPGSPPGWLFRFGCTKENSRGWKPISRLCQSSYPVCSKKEQRWHTPHPFGRLQTYFSWSAFSVSPYPL